MEARRYELIPWVKPKVDIFDPVARITEQKMLRKAQKKALNLPNNFEESCEEVEEEAPPF
jgi:hypothetical protein